MRSGFADQRRVRCWVGWVAVVFALGPRAAWGQVDSSTVATSTVVAGDLDGEYDEDEYIPFIKGDLAHVGTRELVSRFDHVGVRAGPRIIAEEIFLGVAPGVAFYPKPWAFSFHVPLNLLALEAGTNEFGGLKIRREDWDEVSDFAKVIRFITYGRKESPLYFTITSLRPYSLGHGELIQNYQPSIDLDRTITGAVFEAYNRWGGFQLQLNDVTFSNRLVGALAFVKPLGFLDNPILSSLSFGVEYAADFAAPRCVQISEAEQRCVQGSGHAAGFDPLTGQSRDDTFIRTDADLRRPYVEETTVQALGASAELKVLKTDGSDIKVYGTFHNFIDAGSGIAGGALGRFNLRGDLSTQAFRIRAEGRTFSSRYQPAYFDTLYEITKYQTIRSTNPRYQIGPTKYQSVFGDPENGFAPPDDGQQYGYNLEFQYAWFLDSRSGKQIAVALGLQDSTKADDTNFYVHAEVPFIKYVQLFATYMRTNGADLSTVWSSNVDNLVLLGGARVQLLPILFINATYSRIYRIVRGGGREFHLGNENIVDDAGNASPFFTNDRIFESVDTLFVDVELGWEFKD